MMKKKEKLISNEVCRSVSTVSVRRDYSPLSISQLSVEIDNSILTGSAMDQTIKMNSVDVQDYQDGFEGLPESDWTITFE